MTENLHSADLPGALAAVEARTHLRPMAGIVLGSGLGGLATELEDAVVVPYSEIPGFPCTTVPGHRGELVLGVLDGVAVAAMKGRVHLYEGYTPAQVAFPVQLLHGLGARLLMATNASGGLRAGLRPGDLMVLEDHIFLPGMVGLNPLVGPAGGQERFVSMVGAYDEGLRRHALEAGREQGLRVTAGVYAMVVGPSYETPAEARFLRQVGADVVGMSTIPEVVAARALGMRVLGVSCVTNLVLDGPDLGSEGHSSVVAVANASASNLAGLLRGVLRTLGSGS